MASYDESQKTAKRDEKKLQGVLLRKTVFIISFDWVDWTVGQCTSRILHAGLGATP